ncbi:HutD family protein [Paenibacillus frigoriresistens]|uniref:HutD family protein n=1 Tax=Paenibacillus alginolyticus TaxID=59839 RepID=UPI00156581AC|nr:HutD family protein [Paenibacillus frigoriresistens]NRF92481.1 HutD family protein [Paenibacillus frigoriresistens]
MSYSIKAIKKHMQITSAWSGGTTTQLAIFPEHAEYNKRNFLWRISTARIQDEQSLFTSLPDFWRKLKVIEGEVILEYEGSHQVGLKPYEQDSFSGGTVTRSMGKVTDFNLITAAGCRGELEALLIKDGTSHEIECHTEDAEFSLVTEAFYCTEGRVRFSINEDQTLVLEKGDFYVVSWRASLDKVDIRISHSDNGSAAYVIRASIVS